MLDYIFYPVAALLWFWHQVVGAIPFLGPDNGVTWVLAVLLLVVSVRVLLFRPFVSQVRAMRKMQQLAPKIARIKEQYADDKRRQDEELLKFQREQGVNPLGGCLPLLVQIPVFIMLFQVLLRFKPDADSVFVFDRAGVADFVSATLFGAKLSSYVGMSADDLAALDTTRAATMAVGIPLVIAASLATYLAGRHALMWQRRSAKAAEAVSGGAGNAIMLYLFPVVLLVGGPFFPLAVLVFWLFNTLWTWGQQWVVYRRFDREAAAEPATGPGPRDATEPDTVKQDTEETLP